MRTINSVLGAQDRAPWRWVTLASGPVIVIDASLGFHFRVVLTENAALEPPQNGVNGQRILLRIEQDTTGGRTLTPNTAGIIVKGSVTEDTTAGAVAFWELVYDEIAAMWEAWSLTATQATGADTALSNLASVAINTTIASDTDNTDDLGTSSIYWRQVFVGDSIVMKNATKIQANAGSSGTIYFDTAAIHLSFSAKPVSLWTGSLLAFDEAVSLGSTPGTTGIIMETADWNFKYGGTTALAFSATNETHTSRAAGGSTIFKAHASQSASIIKVTDSSSNALLQVLAAGGIEMAEQTAPSAPSSNAVRIYAEDNGAGKTRLMALFPSGVAQQIAIEP